MNTILKSFMEKSFFLTISDALLWRGETCTHGLVLLSARHHRRQSGAPFASGSAHPDGTEFGKRRVQRYSFVDFRVTLACHAD